MKNEIKLAEKLKNEYSPKSNVLTNIEQLKQLDKKVKKPVNIFSYIYGTIGSLVMGTGMCIAMGVLPASMPLGIAIGLVGIGVVSSTYPIHKKWLKARKAKYANQIIQKSNQILNSEEYVLEQNNTLKKSFELTSVSSKTNDNERQF